MPTSNDSDEKDKLVLELRKLRWELSFWARAAAVAVPIAAFVIAASQTYIAVQDAKNKDALALRDLELKRIESGVKLVEFTNTQTDQLLSTDIERRTRALTYASTLLPPQQACIVINAVIIASPGHADFVAPARSVRELIVRQHSDLPPPPECTDDILSAQDAIRISMAQSTANTLPPTVGPPPSAPAASSTCRRPPDVQALKLVVYYQVVQAADRPIASRIGFEMPEEFPSAGTEVVPSASPAKQRPEVRYYHTDQQSAAEWLACMLTEAYTKIVGTKPRVSDTETPFEVRSLSGRYKDLPRHRVEVCFPAIKPQR